MKIYILFFFTLLNLIPSYTLCAQISFIDNDNIFIEGDIIKGDTENLDKIIKSINRENNITINFNSLGGEYLEGIKLGTYIFDNGLSTKVRKGSVCYSACATAFLGGRFFGSSYGWGHSKHIEVGAKLGFHTFYNLSHDLIPTKYGIDAGKIYTNLYYAYLAKINLNPNFMIPLLFRDKNDMFIVNTPDFIKRLNIVIDGKSQFYNDDHLTEETIINLAINAVSSLNINDWDNINPIISKISGKELLFDVNLAAYNSLYNIGNDYMIGKSTLPLSQRVHLKNTKDILSLYFDLKKIDKVPEIGKPDSMYRVDGFNNIHAYLSKRVYILGYNSYKQDFRVEVIILPLEDFNSKIITYKTTKYGNIVLEMHKPDNLLW